MSATAKSGTAAPAWTATRWAPAALACMGVVFGDIGTSPLYTLNVAAKAASPSEQVSPEAVLGIVSLIFWSLIIVVSIKYAILIMRADNHGEGGILALLALVSPRRAKQNKRRAVMVLLDPASDHLPGSRRPAKFWGICCDYLLGCLAVR